MRVGWRRRIVFVVIGCLIVGGGVALVLDRSSDGDEPRNPLLDYVDVSAPSNVRRVEARLRRIELIIRAVGREIPAVDPVFSRRTTDCVLLPGGVSDPPSASVDFHAAGSVPDLLADFSAALVARGFSGKELIPGSSSYSLRRDEGGWVARVLMLQTEKHAFVVAGRIKPDPCM